MSAYSWIQIGNGHEQVLINLVRESYSYEDAALFQDGEAVAPGFFASTAGVLKQRLRLLGWDSPVGSRLVTVGWSDRVGVEDRDEDLEPDQLIQEYVNELGADPVSEDRLLDTAAWKLQEQWGYIPDEGRNQLAYLIERLPAEHPVMLDLREVIAAGAVPLSGTYCQDARVALAREARGTMPTIVLTEGRTDARILAFGLRHVRPEYAGFLTLLDYDLKPEGSAGTVATTLRAFAAAGVGNRVIGLVDNDAAGVAACRSAGKVQLPDRMMIVMLPDLQIARHYPTVGPAGPGFEDVNGTAVSIEMFLPDAVLRNAAGDLELVRWATSASPRQGALDNKSAIQRRFSEAAKAIEAGDEPFVPADWERLARLMDLLVQA